MTMPKKEKPPAKLAAGKPTREPQPAKVIKCRLPKNYSVIPGGYSIK